MTIFPQFSTRCSSVVYGGPGSYNTLAGVMHRFSYELTAPSKRYGWQVTLRSCMTIFISRVFPSFFPVKPTKV